MKWLFFLILFISACSRNPQKYINLAERALKAEDQATAFTYLQKAYEESLEDHFFWQGRDQSWGRLTVSRDRKRVLLARSNKDTEFRVINLPDDKIWEGKLPGKTVWSDLSETGKYAVFVQKNKDICQLAFGVVSSRKGKLVDIHLDCRHRPAISDNGELYFMHNGKIGIYYVGFEKNRFPAYKKTPNVPFKSMPAFSWFHISEEGTPFMTYGLAGRYKLYNLKEELKLMTTELSSGAIYFIAKEENPFVIIGGAGNHFLAEVITKNQNYTLKKYSKKAWDEVTLKSKKEFYFLEYTELLYEKNRDQKVLPFWSRDIHLGADDALYFLSRIGTPIKFSGKMPSSVSETYYKKAIELDKSK